ncbi:MAG: hypothetical protein UY02_C0046G0005 [Candidatus Giovannonibacteria bacterium GW2011_GWB1_47_6b]|uniref:Uncharacterized protein n=1 Tax=Candidatus Giovannonibacteria bacterium GW2011_GWB1_47_6b TaxID=1618655 RepID=A0A0G1T1E9_9BACT|nr:MAG: hypothetical protein UY02_C0046G0005 [Candidatus Giovannonibacteria bacterium GW2011_GWB1_47_6b]
MAQKKGQKKAKGIPKRATTNKGRCVKFFNSDGEHRRLKRKLVRVLKSSGLKAAAEWAKDHGMTLSIERN